MSKLLAEVEAPDFVLTDLQGQDVYLKGFRNKKKILLVFNRGFSVMALYGQEVKTFKLGRMPAQAHRMAGPAVLLVFGGYLC